MPLVLLALSAALARAPDDIAQPADACLPPPDAELAWQAAGLFEDSVFDDSLFDDAVVFAPGGLSSDQLSEALDEVMPEVGRCVPTEQGARGALEVELTVSCTGQVTQVAVSEAEQLEPELVACVAERLAAAPFPSHSLPEGFSFAYALQFDIQ